MRRTSLCRLLRAICAAALVLPGTAHAQFGGGLWKASTGGGGTCPHAAAGFADGCAGANQSATYQHSDCFTVYCNQNSQVWVGRPPWDVAGVDYPTGRITAVASMKDPTNNANYGAGQPGCSWDAGNNWTDCGGSGSQSLTLKQFNWTNHRLYIHGHYCGGYDIEDNNFDNGAASDVTNGDLVRVEEPGCGAAYSYVFKNNTLNGETATHPNLATLVTDIRDGSTPTNTISYNHFANIQGKAYICQCGNNDPNVQFNSSELYASDPGVGQHGEFSVLGGSGLTTSIITFAFNFYLQPKTLPVGYGGPTSFDFISAGCGSTCPPSWVLTTGNIHNNTYLSNAAAGGASQVSSLLGFYHNTYTTLNIYGNYIAPEGAPYCILQEVDATIGTTNWGAGATANIDLHDGSTINTYGQCPGHD